VSNVALIDGDVILYAVGFASQETFHLVDGKTFEDKPDAVHYCERYGIDEADIEPAIRPEPIDHCLATVKKMLDRIQKGAEASTRIVLLSGDTNFRTEWAKTQPYKGNRNQDKPFHYQNIRDYLITVGRAVIVEGEEADDQLSIRCMARDNHVICTVDKDLDNTPGLHYNWNKPDKGVYDVGPVEADRNFYLQLLSGDSTDNIPGLFKLTGTRASPKKKDAVRECTTPEEMYRAVFDIYMDALLVKYEDEHTEGSYTVGYAVAQATEMLKEIGPLLWMRREEGEIWTPPTK